MSVVRVRPLVRVSTAAGAVSVLLVGATGAAQAATFPHVTPATARAALPAAKALPGGVKAVGKLTTVKNGFAIPCSTDPKEIKLPGTATVAAVYATSAAAAPAKTVLYRLSVAVFTTPAKAAAATARLNAAQRTCPAIKTTKAGAGSVTVKRTIAAKYGTGAWSGYRTVVHITATGTTTTLDQRVLETYLTRGNVIVSIEQLAPSLPGNGAAQTARQRTVTALVLSKVAASKG